ncbi:MAG: Holliday junction resolvase RuvX [Christensenellales bacterium]|jgi:putative Holliday junction resolvase
MRVLGLDIGDVRIGVALSDPFGWTAQALEIYTRSGSADQDAEHIRGLIEKHEVEKLVVGLPKNMDGTIGFQAEATMAFADKIKECSGADVVYWDERLTTASARRSLIEGGMRRGKRKKVVDQVAAVFILQAYLDSNTATNA